ncbi:MAG: hypothetical protein IPG55_02060 [Saprospiraceae bacterium]|nr:hypothetical protein [Candidatus Defluviibacterium haderslevense]MBK7244432.1 hypothetical protein [Candidatus Defluviibacterium haderslevense]
MEKIVKSGNEILNDFFESISQIENVDKALAESLTNLYREGKLTDTNIKNKLSELRNKNDNKN